MTIPTLLNRYQMKVFETAFKKQYSVFQNAINYTILENGTSECYTYWPRGMISYQAKFNDCTALEESLVSILNLTPIKHGSEYKYTQKADVLANGGKTINEVCNFDDYSSSVSPFIDVYTTKDGAIVKMSLKSGGYLTSILFDVNGLKGPNKWGYDVFFMTLSKRDRNGSLEQKIYLTDEYCSIVEKGGRLPRTILQNKEKTEDNDFSLFWH